MRFSRGFIALLIFRCSISSTASISRSILILAQPAQLLSACRSHLPRTVGCLMFKLVKMQSSHLLHRQKLIALSGSEAFAGSRSLLSTALARRLKLPHQPKCSFRSGGRGREGESRVSSAFRNPSESRSSWTSYTGSRVMKSGEDNSSEEEDALKVSTYFDPPEGKITTRPAVEESDAERRYQVEESFGVEGSVEKKTSGIAKGRLTADSKKIEATSFSSVVTRRKSGKVKTSWVCENCCEVYGQWWGICTSCNAMNSIKKLIEYEASTVRGSEITEDVVRPWLSQHSRMSAPLSLADINLGPKQAKWRIPLSGQFGMEVSSVLGGGVVPGSLILIGGDPGVGKSTLLLQIAALLAQGLNFKGPAPVLYVSGEESIEQIGNRADRMTITSKELFLYSSTDVEDILEKVHNLSPQALIVDSIQTVYLRGVNGSAGNITQVKECTSAFMRFAKQTNIPVFLIGHVTKSGDIAGPRILEHMVDVVLYMEGERYSSYRLLRSVKNRFGSTDELGVFEMSESGLQAVSDPSEIFLSENFFSDSEVLVGLAVTVVIDGSRTFLLEIQALCVSDTLVTRHINGIETSRADMIISVLMKQAGLKLRDNVIFLNVVSGFKLAETAGDLAIVAAICSSFFEFPIPNNVVFIGEVGLGGELRTVPRMDKRVLAATKLGFKRCIIPKAAEKSLKALKLEMAIVGCKNLNEVINTVFSSGHAEIVSSAPVD